MSKNTIKKIIIVLIVILSTCTITACKGKSDVAVTFLNTNMNLAVVERFNDNLDIVKDLYTSGFLSENTYKTYVENITKLQGMYSNKTIKIDENGINGDRTILKAVSRLRTYSWQGIGINQFPDTITLENGTQKTVMYSRHQLKDNSGNEIAENVYGFYAVNNAVISNALVYGTLYWNEDHHVGYYGTVVGSMYENHLETNNMLADISSTMSHIGSGDCRLGSTQRPGKGKYRSVADSSDYYDWKVVDATTLQAYPVISDDLAQEISEKMNYTIYVLKPDIPTVDGQSTLDEVVNAISKATAFGEPNKDNASQINNTLKSYFTKLEIDGKPVKVLDLLPGGADYLSHSLIRDSDSLSDAEFTNATTDQKCGKDLVIFQDDVNKPVMSIKFHEFNKDAYDNLVKMLGLTKDMKYMFVPGTGDSNRCYLLEYPVYALENIYEDSSNSNKVCGTFTDSGLGINLYSGRIIKYDGLSYPIDSKIWTSKHNEGQSYPQGIEEYYTVKGAKTPLDIGKSSFMMHGKAKERLKIYRGAGVGASTYYLDADIPRIILRDYLEATYAPGFNTDNLVVFGRKIRLRISNWKDDSAGYNSIAVFDKSDPVGYFIDKDGNEVANSSRLYITDFCDWRYLQETSIPNKDGPNTEYKAKIVQIRGVGQECQTIPGKPVEDRGPNPTIEDLDLVTQTSLVKIACPWPSQFVNANDFSTNTEYKQRFWIIATKKGLFNSGLYSGWINSTSSTASMDWWNSYLEANQFTYRLDHKDVNDFLLGNYAYQVGQTGIVILDLDTIAFIQAEMTEESEQERAELIRTIFIILGWIFICYSILLVPAWILDTNSDIGMDLLTKMTFGNWVAIKYREDIPNNDQSDTKYIGTTELVVSVMILMLIGILLIKINIFDLVILLIKTVGNIAQHIEKMIKGMGV